MRNFRAPDDLMAALDRAIADDPDQPSRSELIRRLLTEALTAKGYLDTPNSKTTHDV